MLFDFAKESPFGILLTGKRVTWSYVSLCYDASCKTKDQFFLSWKQFEI